MSPRLVHVYGDIYIQAYGLAIALGLLLFVMLLIYNPQRKALVNVDQFLSLVSWSIIVGIVSGRLMAIAIAWVQGTVQSQSLSEIIVHGSLSILGTVIGITLFIGCYLWINQLPVLKLLDLFALYAPLLQSMGRLGCFFAGCCYGSPTKLPWAITYHSPDSQAPLCVALHPSQLYSAFLLLLIFVVMYKTAHHFFKKPGMPTSLYFILIGSERCITDSFRGERTQLSSSTFWSLHQGIAWCIIGVGVVGFLYFGFKKNKALDKKLHESL
jgi:phosphatidylglycerol:prolipoprotein diacylglycerol transferase